MWSIFTPNVVDKVSEKLYEQLKIWGVDINWDSFKESLGDVIAEVIPGTTFDFLGRMLVNIVVDQIKEYFEQQGVHLSTASSAQCRVAVNNACARAPLAALVAKPDPEAVKYAEEIGLVKRPAPKPAPQRRIDDVPVHTRPSGSSKKKTSKKKTSKKKTTTRSDRA